MTSPVHEIRPTEVQDWKLCPQYWQLKHREGWKPKTVHKWEVQAWIGTAIHAGIAAWVQGHEDPEGMAQATLAVCEGEALMHGREVEGALDDAFTSVRVNTRKFCAQAPAWLQTGCRGSELELGAARLDWIGHREEDETEWVVVDFKTKRTKPRNLEAYQWGLRRSWQMTEYVRRASTHPDSPARGALVTQAEVQTIILDHFDVLTDAFVPVHWAEKERVAILSAMTSGVSWRNEQHCRNWFGGDCPYLRACWEYEGDRQRMTVEYVQTGGPYVA